jgi:xylulokinase
MYLLGIDSSTTATKALLIDRAGMVVATAASEYPYATPQPGWTEQDPELFWNGTVQSIRAVLEKAGISGKDVAAVGLTGQMHGMTLLDHEGTVIRPCILWNDQRTASQCAAATALVGAERLIELTGNPMLTGFTVPKILWTRDNEPEAYARIAHVLLPKDYVRYRLTGECFSDVADASGTGLFDVRNRRWSDELLQALAIPRQWLPEVTESPVASTKISPGGAAATGLLAGTPVVAGAGDQAAQAVGAGIVREGIVSVTIGTSGVVFAHAEAYPANQDGRLHAFCHAVPGAWHMMGVMLSAGGSLRWYRDLVGAGSYDALLAEAAAVPVGSEGLIFLPYLTGERAPHPDPTARGAFVGLTVRHGQPHLTRAVVEGVSLGLNDSLEIMRGLGIPAEQIRASGGGARSPFWRQILADVFDAEIVTLAAEEGAAYGAALLAAVGAEVFPTVQAAAEQTVQLVDTAYPGPNQPAYGRLIPRYQALYPLLKEEFAQLATL